MLTVGTDTAASTRVRGTPVAQVATADGWKVKRFVGDRRGAAIVTLMAIFWRPRVVFFQKVPMPGVAIRWISYWSKRVVFDLDDAIYFGYPGHEEGRDRLERRVDATVRRATLVTVSTPTIAEDIAGFGGKSVAVFAGPAPAIVDSGGRGDGVIWLGSPSTFAYIDELAASISVGPEALPVVAIGAPSDGERGEFRMLTWSPSRQFETLRQSSVGLMPLPRGRWEDRKAAYKVLEYLACGIIPVVEDGPAVRALLGAHQHALCVTVRGGDWRGAVHAALQQQVDEPWLRRRDELFDELSPHRFAHLVLGEDAE